MSTLTSLLTCRQVTLKNWKDFTKSRYIYSRSALCLCIPYFLEKMPQLLFISALPQCGIYSRAPLIRGRRLIPLRVLTCKHVPSTFTRQFPADAMTDHGEFVFVCSFMCTSLCLVARHRRAVKARKRRG